MPQCLRLNELCENEDENGSYQSIRQKQDKRKKSKSFYTLQANGSLVRSAATV